MSAPLSEARLHSGMFYSGPYAQNLTQPGMPEDPNAYALSLYVPVVLRRFPSNQHLLSPYDVLSTVLGHLHINFLI